MGCRAGEDCMDTSEDWGFMASRSHLDLSRAPYVVYGVKYIDLLSLCALPLYSLLSTIPLCSAPLFATSKSVQSLTPEGILNHCYKAGPYGIQGECDIYIYI